MIKNIIFDLAGVVLNLNLERDRKALSAVGFPDFYELHNHPEFYRPTIDYLNGLCSAESFCNAVRPYCLEGVTDEQLLWAMDAVLADIPASRLKLLTELKKKYNIFLLSNIYEKAWNYAEEQITSQGYATSQIFDRLFLSYEMQLAKPDPLIFKALIEATGILPEETLYFDDSKENIKAGKAAGLQAYLVPINCLEECLEETPALFHIL